MGSLQFKQIHVFQSFRKTLRQQYVLSRKALEWSIFRQAYLAIRELFLNLEDNYCLKYSTKNMVHS